MPPVTPQKSVTGPHNEVEFIGARIARVRAVAVDVDGTLLAPDHTITQSVQSAVTDARTRGLLVVLASSRGPVSLRAVQAILGLDGEWFVAYQGGLIGRWTDDGTLEVLNETRIPATAARRVETLAEQYGLSVGRHTGTVWRVRRIDDAIRYEANVTGEHPLVSTTRTATAASPHKLSIVAGRPDLVSQLVRFADLIPSGVSAAFSHPDFLEVTAAGVDKAHGIKTLSEHLGIGLHEFAAIGDGPNDQTLLAAVGHGIAMGHAPRSVREHAAWLTTSNSDDGVAIALGALQPPRTPCARPDPAGAPS